VPSNQLSAESNAGIAVTFDVVTTDTAATAKAAVLTPVAFQADLQAAAKGTSVSVPPENAFKVEKPQKAPVYDRKSAAGRVVPDFMAALIALTTAVMVSSVA